jgi:alpha-L-rhamnosidase
VYFSDEFFRYRQGEGGEPALYFELRVNTPSGQQSVLVSDSSWTVSQGPILSDSVYNGEIYDARSVLQLSLLAHDPDSPLTP